ncbi:MAG TPA: ATP-binding protein, partial [Candidatus Methylomirabilis sp.]
LRLALGEGVVGTVARDRTGRIVNDIQASPYANTPQLAAMSHTAVLAAPLLYRERLLGVIAVNNGATARPFAAGDLALLQLFAAQAAIAIENARLYDAVRRDAAHLEELVVARTAQLVAASQHKSAFLANMSHELRTPLNSILGFAQLLQEQTKETLSTKHTRFLTNIYTSGQHLLTLINDILDLSKVEAGKITLEREPLAVAGILEDLLVIARGLAYKKGQTIRMEAAPDLPALPADPVRFKQIFFNLVSNAVKFTPDGGTITVAARRISNFQFPISNFPNQDSEPQSQIVPEQARDGSAELAVSPEPVEGQIANQKSQIRDFLEIAVTDTGVGIRPEDIPRLFTEFTQLETTAAQAHEGTGLGLALTKRLVELHGGTITAASDGEGQGSTFTVLLPVEGGETGDQCGRES